MAIHEHDWSLTDDTALKAVDSILARVEKNMTDDDYMRTLQKSPYQRSKASANLDYAKSLLLKLEQLNKPSSTSRSTSTQAPNTTRHRLVLKTFGERLDEMETADANHGTATTGQADSSDDEDEEDVQELLRRFAPARASTGIETEEQPEQELDREKDKVESPGDAQTHAAAATLTSTLRARRPNNQPSTSIPTATTTSSSTPFAPRPQTSASTNESLMTSHTLTQEDLTSSLLSLAQALNKSTLSFSSALNESDNLVDGVAKGLDKNIEKMSIAGRAMMQLKGAGRSNGTLGRMWALWDSVGLWIKVAIAWVVLLVVMSLFPKLRL